MGVMTTIAAISAGTAIYGAIKGSQAAKKASEQQAASADKALALQKEMYTTTREDLAPYRTQGQQGLTALSQYLGIPAAPMGARGAAPAGLPGVPGQTPGPVGTVRAPGAMPGAMAPGPAGPRPLAQVAGAARAPMPAQPGGGAPPGMVAMRSPSGAVGYVPQARVAEATAAGGQVVS